MAKTNSKRREWTRDDIRNLKAFARHKDASAENCSDTQEVRRRNSTEGFQPWSLVGFAGLECQSGHKAHREDVQSGFPVTGLLPGRLS